MRIVKDKPPLIDLWDENTDTPIVSASIFQYEVFMTLIPTPIVRFFVDNYIYYFCIIILLLEMALKSLGYFEVVSNLEQILIKSRSLLYLLIVYFIYNIIKIGFSNFFRNF